MFKNRLSKLIYLGVNIIIFTLIGWLVWVTFNQYQNVFKLSDQINVYLKSVSLKQLNVDRANEVHEFLSASSSVGMFNGGLNDPFKGLPAVEAETEQP